MSVSISGQDTVSVPVSGSDTVSMSVCVSNLVVSGCGTHTLLGIMETC